MRHRILAGIALLPFLRRETSGGDQPCGSRRCCRPSRCMGTRDLPGSNCSVCLLMEPSQSSLVVAVPAFSRDQEPDRPFDSIFNRFSGGPGMRCWGAAGWPSDRQNAGRLASYSVLPGGMAAGGYRLVRGRDSAEKRLSEGLRLTRLAAASCGATLLIHPVKMVNRACPLAQRLSIGDGGGHVGLG